MTTERERAKAGDFRDSPLVTILEMIKPFAFATPCRYCDGTGREPLRCHPETLAITMLSSLQPCRVCQGYKILRLHSFKMPMPHVECLGTGRRFVPISGTDASGEPYETDYAYTCDTCRGYGIFVPHSDRSPDFTGISDLESWKAAKPAR